MSSDLKHVFKRAFGAGVALCFGLLTVFADSSSVPRAAKNSPLISIAFPTAGFYYSAPVWNKGFPGSSSGEAGCGTAAGDICGNAGVADGGVDKVQVSVKKGSGSSAKFWDGIAFNSNDEVFTTADGTAHWNLSFGFDRFPAGVYTLHVRATDSAGNIESGPLRIFSVSPEYIVIPVISSLEVMGKGAHPEFKKLPATVDLKVFGSGDRESTSYDRIWEGADSVPFVPSTSQLRSFDGSNPPGAELNCPDCGVRIQYGNDDAYLYEIMAPANTSANRAAFGISGSYLIIGKSIVCLKGMDSFDAVSEGQCSEQGGIASPVYTGIHADSVQPGSLTPEKHLNVTVDGNGRLHSMKSRRIQGTSLFISIPASLDLAGGTEMIPIVYESIGDWQVKMSLTPPDGVASDTTFVELPAGSGDTAIMQIEVAGNDAGASGIEIAQHLTYQGKTIDIQMNLKDARIRRRRD